LGNVKKAVKKVYHKAKKVYYKAKKYVKKEHLHGQIFYSLPKDKLVGRIEWDEKNNGEVPRVAIDGHVYNWHQIGRMLMAYEGWNVQIKIDEVGEWED